MTTLRNHLLKLSALLAIFCLSFSNGLAETYYHITLKAFLEPSDNTVVEWAWATLVEIPKDRAFPEEAALAAQYGGSLRGSVLAMVRASAWRSSHSKTIDMRCSGRPAEMTISWEESAAERVSIMGGLDNPDDPDQINFGFTTREILLENGQWIDPMSRAYVVAGPPAMEGEPAEEMRGSYILRPVNYLDPLKHYTHCGRRWTEQYLSVFNHFHFRDVFEINDNEIFTQRGFGPRNENNIVCQIIRSLSRQHPGWQQREFQGIP